jgi:hypothetical protein
LVSANNVRLAAAQKIRYQRELFTPGVSAGESL